MEKKKVVIALGGNALGKDVEEQKEAVAKTAKVIVDLAQQGLDIIVTHGNGPQVGMIQNAMDNLVVTHENYKQVPLPTSVAMSQGYIGIDLQNAIKIRSAAIGRNAIIHINRFTGIFILFHLLFSSHYLQMWDNSHI